MAAAKDALASRKYCFLLLQTNHSIVQKNTNKCENLLVSFYVTVFCHVYVLFFQRGIAQRRETGDKNISILYFCFDSLISLVVDILLAISSSRRIQDKIEGPWIDERNCTNYYLETISSGVGFYRWDFIIIAVM